MYYFSPCFHPPFGTHDELGTVLTTVSRIPRGLLCRYSQIWKPFCLAPSPAVMLALDHPMLPHSQNPLYSSYCRHTCNVTDLMLGYLYLHDVPAARVHAVSDAIHHCLPGSHRISKTVRCPRRGSRGTSNSSICCSADIELYIAGVCRRLVCPCVSLLAHAPTIDLG